ncbi:MAG: PatA/PatG family cyanobactin maturation protease [Bacteroidetes bacterium]|nr:PatA/PatG family cyanobactin maturation protease [Bacteroidota bacterium]
MAPTARQIHDIIPDLTWLWNETKGDTSVCVAIIDGKVNIKHPVLSGANFEILETHTGIPNGRKGVSSHHGTHIASIIFGQHGSEVKGIAPRCKGLSLPVFFDDASGNVTPCSQLDLARTIIQAADAGAHIINISGGELNNSGAAHPLLAKAIQQCAARNVLIVTAAGNDGCACLHIPGALPSVLVVGGMNGKGDPLEFSNWGAHYRVQGILAPGENIPGAIGESDVGLRTGTSFAAPIVSGIAALLLSIQIKRGKKPDPEAVRKALLDTADGCKDWQTLACQRLLKGRLNAKKAYSFIHPDKNRNMEILHPNQDPAFVSEPPSSSVKELATNGVIPSGVFAETSLPPTVLKNTAPQQGVLPSCGGDESCSCGSKKAAQPAQMVYALGTLGFDLVSEARRDSLSQHIEGGNPYDATQLLKYLGKNPWEATAVTWTLNLNATPIYAVMPYGPYAADGYKRLQEFLGDQLKSGADRISVPGIIAGQVRLMSGQVVPVIVPELRCMYNWNVAALLTSVLGTPPAKDADKRAYEQQKSAIANFLERIYHELQNLGTSPQDRAINYAATNALNAAGIFSEALKDNMQLDTVEVERSAVCRMDSDCWDVVLCFFDPEKQLVRARKCYRFTIDVSDVCPVMVGAVRGWFVR